MTKSENSSYDQTILIFDNLEEIHRNITLHNNIDTIHTNISSRSILPRKSIKLLQHPFAFLSPLRSELNLPFLCRFADPSL